MGVTKQTDLKAYLFEGRFHPLSGKLVQWMEASSRFTLFVEANRDKIRKKVRLTRQPESALDLGGELEVAYRLLNDRRLTVAYEPYASAKKRAPAVPDESYAYVRRRGPTEPDESYSYVRRRGTDFAITYRVNLLFNIEVARIRVEQNEADNIDLPRKEERILRILLDKLGQMQPGMANLLVIQTRQELVRSIDLGRFMQEVKIKVEKKDPSFYALSSYASPAAFYQDFLLLSGILLWGTEAQLWVNKQARPALAEKVLYLVSSLLSGAPPA